MTTKHSISPSASLSPTLAKHSSGNLAIIELESHGKFDELINCISDP